jgi:hypothetical protein
MKYLRRGICLSVMMVAALTAVAQQPEGDSRPAAAEQLFALANQSRAQAGVGPLEWDPALADAAMRHCRRMAMEGPISHRYGGELDVAGRAAQAGARFSLIEENIAVGSYVTTIHDGWMHSPGHRTNLLNPNVDHAGIAVVAAQGILFAVADYEQAVPVLSPSQIESRVADLIRMSGIVLRSENRDARGACALDHGLPPLSGTAPDFVMRWQGADLDHLPQELVDRLGTGEYRQAEVGSCPAQGGDPGFTVYRIAVLLYRAAPRRANNW